MLVHAPCARCSAPLDNEPFGPDRFVRCPKCGTANVIAPLAAAKIVEERRKQLQLMGVA